MKCTYVLLAALVASFATNSFSDEIVALKNGKRIRVNDNQTWSYVDTAVRPNTVNLTYDTASFAAFVGVRIDKFNSTESYEPKSPFKTNDEIEVNPLVICFKNSCNVNLRFFSTSRDGWRFLKYRTLGALCDGEPIEIAEPSHDGTIGKGYVLEYMYAKIPKSKFKTLASCKTLEMRLGGHEFSIPQTNRNSWILMSERFQ